jgi:hypothetical protein
MKHCTVLCLAILAFSFDSLAQEIETIVRAPLLTTTGGIAMSRIATLSPDDTTARAGNPSSLYLSGNLNISLLNTINMPLSFAWTNGQLTHSASLPFNRFSISPSWKWVKVHAGYTSMHFSPYSLAGHELFGGGVELDPDNGLKVSAVYGRLKKQSFGADAADPSFKRMGGGVSAAYRKERFELGMNLFKARDETSPEYLARPDTIALFPQDNLAGSIQAGLSPIENLRLSAEYGLSALNRNRNPYGNAGGDPAVFHALKARIDYALPAASIAAAYERIDPNYTTLGAYYMTNDYENMTAHVTANLKAVNIALSGGYQRDNLHRQKNSRSSRIIYTASLSSRVSERFDLAFNLSNLQSWMYINDVYSQLTQTSEFQNLDTLNVTQLNYTMNLSSSCILQQTGERRQSINLTVMYQQAAEAQRYSDYSGNTVYNTALSWQLSLVPAGFNASASLSHNYNRMPDRMHIQALTANLSLQKTFRKHLRSGISATGSRLTNQAGKLSTVINLRINGGYTLAQKHNFNLSLILLHSDRLPAARSQYMANLSYAYQFALSLRRQKGK